MAYQLPTFQQRKESIGDYLSTIVNSKDSSFRQMRISSIVESSRYHVYLANGEGLT